MNKQKLKNWIIEGIGYIGVIFTLFSSFNVAIFQETFLLVWICWIIGASLSLTRTIIKRDLPNTLIFIIFNICNIIGIIRIFI